METIKTIVSKAVLMFKIMWPEALHLEKSKMPSDITNYILKSRFLCSDPLSEIEREKKNSKNSKNEKSKTHSVIVLLSFIY